MFEPSNLLLAVPALPLLGALLCVAFGSVKELRKWAHVPAVLCAALSCAAALTVVSNIGEADVHFPQDRTGEPISWFSVATATTKLSADFGLEADQLSGIMLIGITFIGTWIVVFSIGYMHGSPGYPRFFAAVSLFLASMTLLVLADNFLLMFAGWEGVGLCSYLLVGYWHDKPSAAAAARKAFLVTRLGDVGLLLGSFLLWQMAGRNSFNYQFIFEKAAEMVNAHPYLFPAACLLVFSGAVGKSAQFPLYVWLPDAMEGPTPVSALIHAATMVTAGVYLLARCAALFTLCPAVQATVAVIGAFTAILAAYIALTQNDLKRVLAYSTVSQLGFMFLALGCAGPVVPSFAVTAAVFHLFTHAFFKAVLFLSAGSVMHAMHDEIDMRLFSGLRKKLPVTHLAFLCGAAALAGLPLLSGFWSKDMILESALEAGESKRFGTLYYLLFGVAITTAAMTAFYTFRAYFRTFWGPLKMPEGAHPHETWVMNIPLLVLAIGALAVGIVAEPFTHWFSHFLGHAKTLVQADAGRVAEHHLNWPLMIGSGAVALLGIGVAWAMYAGNSQSADNLAKNLKTPYYASLNKLYVDEIYNVLIVQPFLMIAGFCKLCEAIVYDLVRLVAMVPRFLADLIRPLQNGLVQFYALSMAMGLAAIVGYLVLVAK
ncbi:NADH-quinone oxidoreductase subunit L [Zavarzinella formosa]|uniref:NADH-quinone oxidoreductase subunit L n=1 Tax=Zavarzinella formosa TaxID=360055 RepID=UPI0003034520|nr:NADH-quinone oxidoreductase subunit L [Zavarzinella formosa]